MQNTRGLTAAENHNRPEDKRQKPPIVNESPGGPPLRRTGAGGGRLALYLDGRRVAVSARFDPAQYDLALAQPLKIGFGPNDYFRGSLRDLRLYDAALTERRIAGLAR